MAKRLVLQHPSQPRPSAPDPESAHVALYILEYWIIRHSHPASESIRTLERLYLFVVIVRHLQASPLEPALDVEALVGITAVENGLVAADFVCDKVEGLDQPQPQFLALLVLCDGDVFDVANHAKVVNTSARETY